MGIVTMGPDHELIKFIKDKYNINNFIETGTFQGDTTEWVGKIFENVYSIEFSKHWFEHAKRRFEGVENVHLSFGNTKFILPGLLSKLDNGIFWLDAHWCGNESFGEDEQCPLLEELNVINGYPEIADKLFILIDDARLFMSPPPLPHSLKEYPNLSQVIDMLKIFNRHVYIYNDIILGIPGIYTDELDKFLQQQVSTAKPYTPELNHSSLIKRIRRRLGRIIIGK